MIVSNKEFLEFYGQTRENHNKLHEWKINGLKVWLVEGPGRRQDVDISSCRDFGGITPQGSVVVTHDHSVWVKVNSQQWFKPVTDTVVLLHDLDIFRFLVIESEEGGDIGTIFRPGE